MTDRKHPSAAFWATVVVVVALVAYPLSFGPACWLIGRYGGDTCYVEDAYSPILWLLFHVDGAPGAALWLMSHNRCMNHGYANVMIMAIERATRSKVI